MERVAPLSGGWARSRRWWAYGRPASPLIWCRHRRIVDIRAVRAVPWPGMWYFSLTLRESSVCRCWLPNGMLLLLVDNVSKTLVLLPYQWSFLYTCSTSSICLYRRSCRSSNRTLAVPRTRSSFGDRSFAAAGPRLWNGFTYQSATDDQLWTVRRHLKAYLFRVL